MKKLIGTLILGCYLSITISHAAEPNYPKLFFSYSWLYDAAVCPTPPIPYKPLINKAWADEAMDRESEFNVIWEQEAPILFGEIFKNFGRGFNRIEMTATLTVCPLSKSYSDPLVLKVLPYLKSFMGGQSVRPDYAFVDLVFHELLHTWLVENLNWPTPLISKYSEEDGSVQAHLHLMAIQKLIYIELGRIDMLNWIGLLYPKMGGVYARSWDIVNNIEGHEAFISEIKGK